MSFDPIRTLKHHASTNTLSTITLSPDGKTLTFSSPENSIDATTKQEITLSNNKIVSYSLASIYLQILDPNRSLMAYRKDCESYNVENPVKVTDKRALIDYFFGEKKEEEEEVVGGEEEDDDMDIEDEEDEEEEEELKRNEEDKEGGEILEEDHTKKDGEKRSKDEISFPKKDKKHSSRRHSKDHHRHRDHHHHRDKHHRDKHKRRSSKEHKKDKKRSSSSHHHHHHKPSKAPMTNEQLMKNLNIVVDKRSGVGGGDAKKEEEKIEGAIEEEEDTEEKEEKTDTATEPILLKEAEEKNEEELIKKCLSFQPFQTIISNKAIIQQDFKKYTEKIMSLEIPVGDSSSVLRAGAGGTSNGDNKKNTSGGGVSGTILGGGMLTTSSTSNTGAAGGGGTDGKNGDNANKRDFSRVLELYSDMMKSEEKMKRGGMGSGKRPSPPPPHGSDPKRRRGLSGAATPSTSPNTTKPKPTGKPIIIVPNAMTSPITMLNAHSFFQNATFVPRDVAIKKGARKQPSITIKRRVAVRLGGAECEYEIIDNPCTRLRSSSDWNRIVAVIAQGASWQFKGWRFSKPVDVFGRAFGFYVGMDGAPMPKDVGGWNVKIGKLSRDRRGLDNVTYANFWNGLDQWMSVHKKEYFPTDET